MKKLLYRLITFLLVTVMTLQFTVSAFGESIDLSKLIKIGDSEISEDISPDLGFSEDTEDNKKSKILCEVEEKREEFTKHYMTEDKGYIAVVYDGPVHYIEEDGKWEDIDNTLCQVTKANGDKVYKNNKSSINVEFADSVNSEKLVSITDKNYNISWDLIDSYTYTETKSDNIDIGDEPEFDEIISDNLKTINKTKEATEKSNIKNGSFQKSVN